ncbi:hypothetical protein AK830_g3633 [Neonectria ditissima]|uniref:LYC1 C-terminal domain-containing protein n=1 Tax=Neonectria ditissima TaxID=78410 RepID=A0A0P7AY04_9HYPO|nr:hypothetical protein AK830_g3633 [Neonectria ditissima]
MSLPPGFDPDALVLREATDEEKIQSWRNNSVAWKGKLSVSDYIGQQACNGDQDLTRSGRIRYWIYTDGTEIYTSAETLQKPVAVRSADGQVSTEWSYGVAGVFTPKQQSEDFCVVFLPTYAQASWHFASEEYVASKLFKNPDRVPACKGARSSDAMVWCYWLHDFNSDRLTILRLGFTKRIETDDAQKSDLDGVAQILRAARAEAATWGLKELSIWDPDKRVLSACKEILHLEPEIRDEIQGNVPCPRWKYDRWGSHVPSQVHWAYREMYAWC